jgi:hypothetical protein
VQATPPLNREDSMAIGKVSDEIYLDINNDAEQEEMKDRTPQNDPYTS